MDNEMPKLETGMLVEVRTDKINQVKLGIVINNCIMYFINSDGFDKVHNGCADLSCSYVSKIYSITDKNYSINIFTDLYKSGDISEYLIWEKEVTLEVTMEEVCKKFGCKVKIVAENKI